ncbi:sulfate adenylyltransferase subunit CysD [Kitasatospora griseola]|uniref:sulfate adenylyltransferase subunit CysD n=1 Tax=Kitasatospora griseola TaxID=2064 RepID=UPI0036DE07D8
MPRSSADRTAADPRAASDTEHLAALEAEAIFILREVVAEAERPGLLFSGGKDSIVMLRLAQKAFAPARIPFPLVHVDTGHNFDEVLDLRDKLVAELDAQLIVGSVQEGIDSGLVVEPRSGMRNAIQTPVLLQTAERHRLNALFGGARRDEEKARAKERVVSFRDEFGQWDPKRQRPELWSLYNPSVRPGESIRVFPLSNWTEIDIWNYIAREEIELPALYYAHDRAVVSRDGMLYGVHKHLPVRPGEEPFTARVRYRTIGDASCTAAVVSDATTPEDVIEELLSTRLTERGATRGDDKVSESAMEDRKREGYF